MGAAAALEEPLGLCLQCCPGRSRCTNLPACPAPLPAPVAKYAQEQPVRIHTTPIERRIERALQAEQRAVRRAKAARAADKAA